MYVFTHSSDFDVAELDVGDVIVFFKDICFKVVEIGEAIECLLFEKFGQP